MDRERLHDDTERKSTVMTPEHYDAYAAARSALANLARTGPDEIFGDCHEMLLELDGLHPETEVTEISLLTHPTRATAWHEAKESIEALVDHGTDSLRVALLLETLERAWQTELSLPELPPGNER
jgi:hypothetical protein